MEKKWYANEISPCCRCSSFGASCQSLAYLYFDLYLFSAIEHSPVEGEFFNLAVLSSSLILNEYKVFLDSVNYYLRYIAG